jgi:hypothetical protein
MAEKKRYYIQETGSYEYMTPEQRYGSRANIPNSDITPNIPTPGPIVLPQVDKKTGMEKPWYNVPDINVLTSTGSTVNIPSPAPINAQASKDGVKTTSGLAQIPQGIPPTNQDDNKNPTPPLTEDVKVKESTETVYGEEAKGRFADIDAKKQTLANNVYKFKELVNNNEDIVGEWKKQVASQARLEDLLDPTSDGFEQFQNEIKATVTKIEAAQKDMEDYQKNMKADPQRYWKETPFLDHAFNAISMLMEGNVAAAATRAGVSMPTGLVQQRIDRAIQDDIARQKEELKSGEAARLNTVNRYRDNLKLLGDKRAAQLKTEVDFMNVAKARLESLKQDPKFQDVADRLATEELKIKLEEEAAKRNVEWSKSVVRNQTTTAPLKHQAMSPEEMRKERELNVSVLGIPMRARSLEDAKTLKEKGAASERAISTLEALEALRGDANVLDLAKLPTDKMAKARALVSDLHMAMKQSFALGALDKGSLEFLQGAVPSPDQWTDALDKYKAMRRAMTLGYTSELNQRVEGGGDFKPSEVKKRMDEYNKRMGYTSFLLED